MDYCGPHGIAWEDFLSWSKTSRDAAILWQRRRNETCTGCGTHPDDWDPTRGGSEVAFRAELRSCRGCETHATAQAQITDAHGGGVQVVLVRHVEAP